MTTRRSSSVRTVRRRRTSACPSSVAPVVLTSSGVREVLHEERRDQASGGRGDTNCRRSSDCNSRGQQGELTQDENPPPARVTANAIHLGDGSAKETAEGARQGRSREKDGSSETKFASLVPAGHCESGMGMRWLGEVAIYPLR